MKNIGENKLLQLSDCVELADGGLRFKEGTTWEEWADSMAKLKLINSQYKLMLGDAIAFGRRKYGDTKVDEYCEQLELPLTDVNQARIMGSTPLEKREEFKNLNAEHFFMAGRLVEGEEERMEWLRQADRNELTAVELKESIESGQITKLNTNNNTSGRNSGSLMTIEAISLNFAQWKKQVADTSDDWNTDQMKEFLDATAEIVKMHKLIVTRLREQQR